MGCRRLQLNQYFQFIELENTPQNGFRFVGDDRAESVSPVRQNEFKYSSAFSASSADTYSTTIDGGTPTVKNTTYLIDPSNFTGYAQVLEESVNGNLTKSYALGDDVLSQTTIHNSSFIIHHFLYDGHGSTRLLTSDSAAITARFNYDAYGTNLFSANVTAPSATNMLYSGEQFDPNLQMQYLRARYYDQNNGRFNRLDAYKGNLKEPQSFHKYAYCHGDAINNSDPTGHFAFSLISFLISSTIGMSLEIEYALAVVQAGNRLLERGIRSITNYSIRNQPKDHDNATIIVHGVAPHEYSYSKPFQNDLRHRSPNQDYYEFIWSGFAVPGYLIPTADSHNIAVNSFREAVITLHGKGYRNVNIIAHSWGTVISRDVLLDGSAGNIHTWVTMGSPLPESTPWANGLQNWINIFSPDDPIIYLGPTLSGLGVKGGTGYLFNKSNIRQVGTFGTGSLGLNNHTIYWNDPRTLDTIGNELRRQ